MADTALLLGALVFGYLLGSVPFGLLLVRAAGLGDVRAIGSGNIGTTNVLRTGRKDLAAATLVLDALKGTLAVVAAGWFFGSGWPPVAAGVAAFLGHCFPVWLRFRGGKGVATYLGVALAFHWIAALVFALSWIATAAAARYSSLSALVASVLTPGVLWWLGLDVPALATLGLAIVLWVRHGPNIRRLVEGKESRLGRSR